MNSMYQSNISCTNLFGVFYRTCSFHHSSKLVRTAIHHFFFQSETNLFGSIYIYIYIYIYVQTGVFKSSHARHLPFEYRYNYTYIVHIRTLTHIHTQTNYTQTLKDSLLKHKFIGAILCDKDSHAPRTKCRIVQHHILYEEDLSICV